MEYIIAQLYLSVFVKFLIRKMEKNRALMKRLIDAGAAYNLPKLSRLDLDNQRMGMQMHEMLLRLLEMRAHANEKKERSGCEDMKSSERQRRLMTMYGGGIASWTGNTDII